MTPEMRPKSFKKPTPGALWDQMGPKDAQNGGPAPPGDHFPQFWNRFFMFFHIVNDFVSTCNFLNRPSRITKPIAYRPKSPRATGHLVKSTVDDHDHGRRPQATTTGDGAPGENDHDHGRRPRPRATDHSKDYWLTESEQKQDRKITEKTPLTNILGRSASR